MNFFKQGRGDRAYFSFRKYAQSTPRINLCGHHKERKWMRDHKAPGLSSIDKVSDHDWPGRELERGPLDRGQHSSPCDKELTNNKDKT